MHGLGWRRRRWRWLEGQAGLVEVLLDIWWKVELGRRGVTGLVRWEVFPQVARCLGSRWEICPQVAGANLLSHQTTPAIDITQTRRHGVVGGYNMTFP